MIQVHDGELHTRPSCRSAWLTRKSSRTPRPLSSSSCSCASVCAACTQHLPEKPALQGRKPCAGAHSKACLQAYMGSLIFDE